MLQSGVKNLKSTDGTILFAEATGNPSNPHVVLLSGLSLSGVVFDDMCADKRLLEKLYIVRYDTRGHGRSGTPSTPEAYESKMFADDFKTVMDAFGLKKPVLVGWSMGAAVATDVVAHLPAETLSGVVYLSGVPATGAILGDLAPPKLLTAVGALTANEGISIPAYQAATLVFNDGLFAHPEQVPYAVKCLHRGHSLSPDIMALCLGRTMDVNQLWEAGQQGLPLLMIQGTLDRHRMGSAKNIEEAMKPHFKNFQMIWLEGRGHALHYECPDDVVENLIKFTEKVSGKNYISA
ncbi:alpha/beta-hydrolase [Roridomyces roridus]|uniref:Alpha/beta-hydrolase n=1 Tax=Roridomyces roridus TaxID=1738132 RepID=A0AAD7CK27_9AGAR|nr:alpha/beta-hydrolase [Roridomyces roridus]